MSEHVLVSLSSIVILGISAQWLAWKLRFPSILFLLIFGFVAGPVTGFLHPDELMGDLLLPFVSICVALILFEGGLTLSLKELREIGGVVFALISVGMAVTWGISSAAAHFVLGLNLPISVLLGAILVVTGPTVIGPLLRHIRPVGKVADVLKWEGITIDPIGALLAVLVFEAILVGEIQEAGTMVGLAIGKTILLGGLIGAFFAWILVFLLRRFWIPDFLQEVVTLSMVIGAFLLSDLLQSESGLFAVTLMGVVMANQKHTTVRHILEFKENLSVLIISVLFIVLSARLDLEVLTSLTLSSLLFLFILVLIARPASVFLSSFASSLDTKEKLFLSWMAPRGIVAAAVSSIFALRLRDVGVDQSEVLVPMTFIVIVGTVTIYGLTAPALARKLGVSQSNPQGILFIGAHSWVLEIAQVIKNKGFNVVVMDTNRTEVSRAKMRDLAAYYGSGLSEEVFDRVNLDGIGKMLAVTSNDEANSLAVLNFNEIFDRGDLFQLRPSDHGKKKKKDEEFSPAHLRGRYLFGEAIDYDYLSKRFARGAIIKSTNLSEEFDYTAFGDHYGGEAVPLFLINANKELRVFATDSELDPKPGSTIIALVDEVEEKADKGEAYELEDGLGR
ncbi:MAG: sodium:proton antiporter [Candidatus Omnitrophica bacterium]|nr:sodium:proton antiporter [Candidatus Omnitrophota bacterium]